MCQVRCSSIQGIYAQLQGGVNLPWVYMHYSIYIYRSARSGVVVLRTSMLNWLGGQSAMGIGALFSLSLYLSLSIYIEIERERSAKFGVEVFKATMLD